MISIPHTWYTVEDYNSKLYIDSTNPDLTLKAFIFTVASSNYTASSLATTLNNLLQTRFLNDNFSCVYNVSVGTIPISFTMSFRIMTDDFAKTSQGISSWYGNDNEDIGHPDYYNLCSINEVSRYYNQAFHNTSFETGFICSWYLYSLTKFRTLFISRC